MKSEMVDTVPESPVPIEGLTDPSLRLPRLPEWREWEEFNSESVQRAIRRERIVHTIHEQFVKRRMHIAGICARSAVHAAAAHHIVRRDRQTAALDEDSEAAAH